MDNDLQIVVTGASGYVAKNVRKYFSENNVKLISISRKNFKKLKNETKIISKNYDEEDLSSKVKNSSALVHLVGIGRESTKLNYNLINVELTQKIVNLCKKSNIKNIIFTSGLGVSKTTSLSYFISKYHAERKIIESGLNYTIFRPSYIIGKNDYFTKHLKQQIKKGEILIPGSGNYAIQPIYIGNVSEIIFKAVKDKKFQNKILDLVGSESLKYKEFVKLFSQGTTKIKKINLEKAYHDAISNPNSDFAIDDLNLLIGDFKGNHTKLKMISKIEFLNIRELLKAGSLL